MKKIQPKELLTKISKKISLQDLLSLKADFQVLFTKRISLQDLQELLNKIAQNKNKLTLIIIVISVILCLDFFFVLRFQMRAMGAISPKIIRLRRNLDKLNVDSIRMQRHKNGLGVAAPKKIVASGQLPWVIEEISRLANQQEVRISQIKPYRQLSQGKTSSIFRRAEEDSLILIDLEVSAGYHQLGRFLADLENHAILLEIEELVMKHSNKDPFEHKIKLKLKTYVANE